MQGLCQQHVDVAGAGDGCKPLLVSRARRDSSVPAGTGYLSDAGRGLSDYPMIDCCSFKPMAICPTSEVPRMC